MVKEAIQIIYNYFQLFIIVPCIVIVILTRSKRLRWNNGLKVSIFGWTAAMISFLFAIEISQTYLFYDNLVMCVNNDAHVMVSSIEFGAGTVFVDTDLGREETCIRLPYGIERKIYVASDGDCQVSMSIDKAGYEDSYEILGDTQNGLTIYTDTPKVKLLLELVVKVILLIIIANLIFSALKWGMQTRVIQMVRCTGGGYKYELIIFSLLFTLLVIQAPAQVNTWTSAWYTLNYNDGIGSRLVAGTLLRIFAGDFIEQKEVLIYLYIMLIVLFILVSFLLARVIRKSEKDKVAAMFFCAMYLACPGSVASYAINIGRLEMFSLIFILMGIVLFEKYKNIYLRYFLIFLFSEFALSAHQGSIFYYYPIIVTVLSYEMCIQFSWKKFILTLGNLAGVFATFFYFQLFSKLRYDTLETAMRILENRTDMELDENAIRLEYFASLKENFEYGQAYFLKNFNYEEMLFVALILLMPLLLFITGILGTYLKEKSNRKSVIYREPILYILLSYMLFIPIYVLMCDWGRWTSALIGTCFFNIGYLYVKEDEIMISVFSKIKLWVEHYQFLSVVIIIYLAGLDKFCAIFSPMLYRVHNFMFGG